MDVKRLVAVCAVTFSMIVLPVSAEDPTAAEIDAIFADCDTTSSPGCALGVIRNGEMIYQRGYGMANLRDRKFLSFNASPARG
jgi:CubicO group peptidase (beta-lactamase class C family)